MSHPVVEFQILSKTPDQTADFFSRLFGWKVNGDNPMGADWFTMVFDREGYSPELFQSLWQKRIAIRTPDLNNNILSLSGGNQQKALFARALGSDARLVLMDDHSPHGLDTIGNPKGVSGGKLQLSYSC